MEVGYGKVYVIEFIAKVTPWNKIHTLKVQERKVCPKVTREIKYMLTHRENREDCTATNGIIGVVITV